LNLNDILCEVGILECQGHTCIRDILKFVRVLQRKLTDAEEINQPAAIAICVSEDDLSLDTMLLLGSYMLIKLNLNPSQVAPRSLGTPASSLGPVVHNSKGLKARLNLQTTPQYCLCHCCDLSS
jgi:hypothetical protein